MRSLAIAAILVGCGSSWSTPSVDGGPPEDADLARDAEPARDSGLAARDSGADLGRLDRDAGEAADGGVDTDAFAPMDAGPPTCADYPEQVHAGDLVVSDTAELAAVSELTDVDGTLDLQVDGTVLLPRLRAVGTLELGTGDGPLEVSTPCLRQVTELITRHESTLLSPPLEVESARLSGVTDVPSLVAATEIHGYGQLRLPGLIRVGEANFFPRSIELPSLEAADELFIQAPAEGSERFGDVPVVLPSLVSVSWLLRVETNGVVRVGALERAGSIWVFGSGGDFSSLHTVDLGMSFLWVRGSSGVLDLPSLVAIEDLFVRALAPSTLRVPLLTEADVIELVDTRPEMPVLERVEQLFVQGGTGFALPMLRYVVEVHVRDVTSTQPLTLPLEGYSPGNIPHMSVSTTQAPELHLLGTSLLELTVDRSVIPRITIPNAATINFVTLEDSEIEVLELSAPPTTHWLWMTNVVGIRECECRAFAPYVIDDGFMSSGGDLRCEGLVPCE